ncbi:hypothetical protein KSF78_0001051 [Schistosoma japonicum]|nr:hypothetical protein KSF78_0001051 [Schistosoma japonicum]
MIIVYTICEFGVDINAKNPSYVEYCIANKYNDCSYIHDLRRNVNADIMKHSSYNCAIIM